MITVEQIIDQAGGAPHIARESQTTRKPIKKNAVYAWRVNGIDEAHWPLMMRLVPGLTVQELFDANRELDRKHPKPRRPECRSAA